MVWVYEAKAGMKSENYKMGGKLNCNSLLIRDEQVTMALRYSIKAGFWRCNKMKIHKDLLKLKNH